MRPYYPGNDEFDDLEEIAYSRSQNRRDILEQHRREERHRKQVHSLDKGSPYRGAWDWSDADRDYCVDDSCTEYFEDVSRIY